MCVYVRYIQEDFAGDDFVDCRQSHSYADSTVFVAVVKLVLVGPLYLFL